MQLLLELEQARSLLLLETLQRHARHLRDDLRDDLFIDLTVEADGRYWVVDYKTNRPSPDRIEDADTAYLAQMAVYAAVLREVFPGRTVEAALVWTDGPKLMPVPEKVMAEALARLA